MTKSVWENQINKIRGSGKTKEILTDWTEYDLSSRLSIDDNTRPKEHSESEFLAFLYQSTGSKLDRLSKEDSLSLIKKGYDISKTIWFENKLSNPVDYINQLFNLGVSGILSESTAEVRMILKDEDFSRLYNKIKVKNWGIYLESTNKLLFLILLRKLNGWEDIKFTKHIMENISVKQDSEEERYLNTLTDYENPFPVLSWLATQLNILEAIEEYSKYILTGKPDNIEKVIIRLCSDAIELIENSHRPSEKITVKLFEIGLIKMVKSSLWTNTYGLSEKVDEYIEHLTSTNNDNPVFDLWPSQQGALSQNLFDLNKTALIVQMPTSAGKTLLSKFYILQTLNLYHNAKIAYIVPTRALVNQVKKDLRNDFIDLDINVDIAIPFADIDPLEEELLLQDTDVLVTTPEKLDVLLRNDHPSVENLRLVVVDEAHNLADSSRGSKLELLLSNLRRENRNLRVLLLSPFIRNAKEIATWLGDNRGHDIFVDWRPSQQFTGLYKLDTLGRGNHYGVIYYIPSSLNTMYNREFTFKIHHSTRKLTKVKQAFEAAKVYEKLGGVLILCSTRITAESFAKYCVESRQNLDSTLIRQLKPLLELIEEELGKDSLLYKAVLTGCAYHHSSLPLIIREEIEEAIANRLITVVSATTTLAQGMNFPISTVVFQSMNVPNGTYSRAMTNAEFWNIAGRAGRALTDKEGHILAIHESDKDEEQFRKYLSDKNNDVLSSLLETLDLYKEEDEFDFSLLRKSDGFTNLLQYIYHILYIEEDIEIEDIVRGSLVYHQLLNAGKDEIAKKLINITRLYRKHISKDLNKKKLMKSIDGSGLSSISMKYLLGRLSQQNVNLNSNKIFSYNDDTLEKYIDLINNIPEINLGIYKQGGNFNPKLVSEITKDWVSGKPLKEIAQKHITFKANLDEKIQHCGKYIYGNLTNNLSWGLAAMLRANGILLGKEELDTDESLIPSYIYFGVNNKEAAALAMLGVPRFAAERLGKMWRKENGEFKNSQIASLKSWLNNLEEEKWISNFESDKKDLARALYNNWVKER
ncbi:DEAD/DEAH box helicase [Bacillus subtilis]|uniref:DEAD/DEAH box helicase n=1 Tax=Bacillus subtilis TaxID=1423 RepID=UPI002DBE0B2A|nr:DEAD/DEAH box helicase [Bacillus subtilis]MEC4001590.1 DEAD/DEAH box helicase [Bacillus subtilis]